MPLQIITPDAIPLLVSSGIVAYIGAQEAWRARAVQGDPIHLIAVSFCTVSMVILGTRFVQRTTSNPEWAEVALRIQLVAAILVIPIAVMSSRALAQIRPTRRCMVIVLGASLSLVAVVLFTDLIATSPPHYRLDALGNRYYELTLQWPFVLVLLGGVTSCVYIFSLLRKLQLFRGRAALLWLGFACVGTAVGINDLLLAAELINSIQVFEYGVVLFSIGAGYFLTHRAVELQTGLEQIISERTEDLEEKQRELSAALKEREQSETRFRQLAAATFEGIAVHERGEIVDVNDRLVAILGHPAEKLIGQPLSSLIAEPDVDAALELAERGGGPLEISALRPDASVFPAEIVCDVAEEDAGRGVLALRDVTDRKQLQSRLLLTDRMAALGTLAAGAAHEINNPLTWVSANLELMGEVIDGRSPLSSDDITELVTEARDGCRRIRGIVEDMQGLTRVQDSHNQALDIHVPLAAAVKMTQHELRHRAGLDTQLGGNLPLVLGAEDRLTQLFINLLLNASHAIPVGRADENEVTIRTSTPTPGEIWIEVQDTGHGIPADVVDRVFDPFFTTKSVGEGTGLGLSISHEIVQSLGGRMEVESTVDVGTTFRVVLPAAEPGVGVLPQKSEPSSLDIPGTARVLVIDDEPFLVQAIERLLRGLDVTTAQTGRDGLKQVMDGDFDVILCDLMMPEFSGSDVYMEAVASRPELGDRFIFLTGGAFSEQADAFVASLPASQLMHKPVSGAELRAAIATLTPGMD